MDLNREKKLHKLNIISNWMFIDYFVILWEYELVVVKLKFNQSFIEPLGFDSSELLKPT